MNRKKVTLIFVFLLFSPILSASSSQFSHPDNQSAIFGKSRSASSSGKRSKVYEYKLKKITAVADTQSTNLILVFDSGVPNFSVEKSQYDDVHIFSIKLSSTDYRALDIPQTEGPINHVETIALNNPDTAEVHINIYLRELEKHRILKRRNKLKLEFLPGTQLPEELWPSRLESIAYVSMGPFNLSLKVEFDDLPRDKRVFLTQDKKKAIIILNNTSLHSSRVASPIVPFISGFKASEGVSDIGVPYYKLVFTSNSNLAFALREDDYRLFIELQKEAIILDREFSR